MERKHVAVILIVVGLILCIPAIDDFFINLPLAMAASAITGLSMLLTLPATYLVGAMILAAGLWLKNRRGSA